VNAGLAAGGDARGVRAGEAGVDAGTLPGDSEARRLLSEPRARRAQAARATAGGTR
jgi:hypothetical protein